MLVELEIQSPIGLSTVYALPCVVHFSSELIALVYNVVHGW